MFSSVTQSCPTQCKCYINSCWWGKVKVGFGNFLEIFSPLEYFQSVIGWIHRRGTCGYKGLAVSPINTTWWLMKPKYTRIDQGFRASLVSQTVKNLSVMSETWVQSLEKEMATHSSILAWRIPWTEEPGGLQTMGSQRVGHNSVTNTNNIPRTRL